MNSATNIVITKATTEGEERRELRAADGVKGGMITVTMHRNGKSYSVRACKCAGRRWEKAEKVAGLSERKALALLETKWSELVAWLESIEPVPYFG